MHAATRSGRKRKQRAATTASPEDLGEVPGVGVPLALVVILLLHVAAIAGIWIHDRWSSNADLTAVKTPLEEDKQPARIPDLEPYMVNTGDTAESIAKAHGVEVKALLEFNEGISEYKPGTTINLPPARRVESGAEDPVAAAPEPVAPYTFTERPPIQTSDDTLLPGSTPGELAEVGTPDDSKPDAQTPGAGAPEVGTPEAEAGKTDEPVLIRPLRSPGQAASKPKRVHVVKNGETLWGIATRYKIKVSQLEKANPGVNASSLPIGKELAIPSN